MSQGMMPSFARGWEKDGYRFDGKGHVVKSFVTADVFINERALITIYQGMPSRDENFVVLGPYKDPQTAKAKAEALMEGL